MKKGAVLLLIVALLSGCGSNKPSETTAAATTSSTSITAPETMPPKEDWTRTQTLNSTTAVKEENPDPESYDNPIAALAESLVSKELIVNDSNLCLIPSEGMNEIFCYEVSCIGKEGRNILVYINAETGEEERILLLDIGSGGVLTV